MIFFAKLDENNVVTFVTAGRPEDDGKEEELIARTGDVYRQTSYDTSGGIYYVTDSEGNRVPSDDQSQAFRGNYAGIGFIYDEERDAFIPPKPYPSWVLNEKTFLWEAPVPQPDGCTSCNWNEELQEWTAVENETE